jgi:allophanate hydrolase subunit 2
VTRSGMPLLAQAMPGHGRVRFRAVDLEQARDLYRAQMGWLANGIEEVQDDEWSG